MRVGETWRGFSDDPIREGNFYGADVVESFLQMNSLEMCSAESRSVDERASFQELFVKDGSNRTGGRGLRVVCRQEAGADEH